MDTEAYVEAVLALVERVPRGRVTTYGSVADVLRERFGGGPRQVARVMAGHGGPVPWWRVVRADGTLPPSHGDEARQAYLEEGTPLRPSGAVDLRAAYWAGWAGVPGLGGGAWGDGPGVTRSAAGWTPTGPTRR